MSRRIPVFLTDTGKATLQEQIIRQVRGLVTKGQLVSGSKLPSSRALAAQLGVARRTVTLAFERLEAEGYVEMRPASGTYVAATLPSEWLHVPPVIRAKSDRARPALPPAPAGLGLHVAAADALSYDFRLGRPDLSLFPIALWRRLIAESLDSLTRSVGSYLDPRGHPLLREALARHLFATRGISCDANQIIIVAGTQDGLNLAGRMLTRSGDTVAIEDPGYLGAARAFQALGARLHPVALDTEGVRIDRLPTHRARLIYVTPSHQFPFGVAMTMARRRALIDWARRTGAMVIEDDYDSDLRYASAPLPALTALAPDCTIYVGTFSKSVGPGFRMGYVVVPSTLVAVAADAKSVMSNGHPWLEQVAMARFIEDGGFEQHLARMRNHYAIRRDRLVRELSAHFPGSGVSGIEGGMHLLWHLPPDLPDADAFQAACRSNGVGIHSLSGSPTWLCDPFPHQQRLVLMAYSALDPGRIGEAVARMRRRANEIAEGVVASLDRKANSAFQA